MSTATDYLNRWIGKAAVRAPSITRTTAQHWPGVGVQHWNPGIVSYGWGIDGAVINGPSQVPVGLEFPSIYVWFSDRGGVNPTGPPMDTQQFIKDKSDTEQMFLTIAGNQVHLRVVLRTWKSEYSVTTSLADAASDQLIFSIPGAGPQALPALLILSLADTGNFGWL
ncbi:hypothetical protein [Arthrobacter livingstonensis]|uniref:hypothetical protein n=1 Tax=Arthrobacter livingstonensis TaxID=670078 RepID=UPI0011B520DB|nr:hypothetical protein [Arthrobacter livingstonensis]